MNAQSARSFRVKEMFYTLQGEGVQAGRPAVFCRFSGCNLWSGREEDRPAAACRFCDTDFSGADAGVFASEEALAERIIQTFPLALRPGNRAEGKSSDKSDSGPAGSDRTESDQTSSGLAGSGQTGSDLAESACAGCKPAECPQATSLAPRPYIVFTGGEPALQITPGLLTILHQRGFELGVESNGTLPLPPGLDWVCISPKAGTKLVTTRGDELKLVWPQPGACPEDFEHLAFRHFILQPCDQGTTESALHNTRLCIKYCLAHPRWRLGLQTHKWIGLR